MEEDIPGNWPKSGVVTKVGEDGTTKSATDGSNLRGKEKIDRYGPMGLEIPNSDRTCNHKGINGKVMEGSGSGMALIQASNTSYDSHLIISEAKRRRSNHGPLFIAGQEETDNPTPMENIDAPKNGPAVGPVHQAHRSQ